MSTTAVLLPEPSPAASAPGSRTALVEARSLTRIWGRGNAAQIGISDVDLDLRRGELVALIGPSGSGKSTLGSLLAGIDQPTSGSLVVAGDRIDRMRPDRLATWRGQHVGIVFQDFHLLPTLTAIENVELAIELGAGRVGRRERRARAIESLERVG
ncbi:MAG TPA: ATP-binding cassette domain-containing protein, partial [Ilumatobacteraceae bacterium]|nr:ATP-binding cassette domain-containing protein [Ilumatobacteraceae bacterium]